MNCCPPVSSDQVLTQSQVLTISGASVTLFSEYINQLLKIRNTISQCGDARRLPGTLLLKVVDMPLQLLLCQCGIGG